MENDDKIQRYINRCKRLITKYNSPNEAFDRDDTPNWTVKELIFWLDWNVIPVCSMSKNDTEILNNEIEILLNNHIYQTTLF